MTISPKKVAIIGAGPSGLVTAKTLLHSFPPGTFAPVVFDSRQDVGGLWDTCSAPPKSWNASEPVTLDSRMRTNLSRFTVAFSDLSWESVLGDGDIPIFPQAGQVRQYLVTYAKRYIPNENFRLGSFVKRTERVVQPHDSTKWRVHWNQSSGQSVQVHQYQSLAHLINAEKSEDFDYLVVASGYFARPYIPEIPGLAQFTGRIIHSSALARGHDPANDEDLSHGNVLVLGGSMSGVEAASTYAMHRSTLRYADTPAKHSSSVYHISSRSFWTLPTYLPHTFPSSNVTFLPLDLTMYDLGRRPTGPIEYYLGPVPKEKAAKTNAYFQSLLGAEYERFGHVHQELPGDLDSRPPWVAIGNDYAGFVQSGTIVPKMGRAVSVHQDPNSNLATVKIETPDGESRSLENITSIVMATGFTPFESLSFLPQDVLSILEYTTDDSFLPLVLDQGGSLRSEIPNLGFVGYYRGPYWGAMEMQARFLGKTWTQENHQPLSTESQVQNIRLLRQPSTQAWRGQFPMGDYVGLMETFSQHLKIKRTELQGLAGPGPVLPARYIYDDQDSSTHDHAQDTLADFKSCDAQSTLNSLFLNLLGPSGNGVTDTPEGRTCIAMAIFRALHGEWKFTRRGYLGEILAGTVAFHPRYPTDPAFDREYVCEGLISASAEPETSHGIINQTIWRLSEAGGYEFPIRIYPMKKVERDWEIQTPQVLALKSAQHGKCESHGSIDIDSTLDVALPDYTLQDGTWYYKFWFDGVSIAKWELSRIEDHVDPDGSTSIASTVYTRIISE